MPLKEGPAENIYTRNHTLKVQNYNSFQQILSSVICELGQGWKLMQYETEIASMPSNESKSECREGTV